MGCSVQPARGYLQKMLEIVGYSWIEKWSRDARFCDDQIRLVFALDVQANLKRLSIESLSDGEFTRRNRELQGQFAE